jgi:septum formation topological specificity factor MinE
VARPLRRCGMSQESLLNMRQNIVRVVADYVDIEAEDLVEVRPLL